MQLDFENISGMYIYITLVACFLVLTHRTATHTLTMDSPYNMAPTSVQGQPFAYYSDSQRQGHYQSDIPYYNQMQYGQEQPLYSSQPMMNMHQMATTNAFRGATMSLTPIASPQPSQMKPTIIMQQGSPGLMPSDTRFIGHDLYSFPSTPPLSASGSTISSPRLPMAPYQPRFMTHFSPSTRSRVSRRDARPMCTRSSCPHRSGRVLIRPR